MTKRLEKLYSLVYSTLLTSCPRLSGNMANGISVKILDDNKIQIVIKARFYDVNEFNRSGSIIYTNKSINGITNYPMWVNKLGAFGKPNKSQFWVNRACYNASMAIASEIKAEVRNKLPL